MKAHFTFLILLCSYLCFAQVGIGTPSPQATLQVFGSADDTAKPDGIIAPRLTRDQLIKKGSSYTSNQTGAIVYVTDLSGTTTTSTANVKRIGYYYFNGTVWNNLEAIAGTVSFTASLGNGSGTTTATTITASGFNTVPLNQTSNIGGGSWNSTSYTYRVPVTGTYLIKSSIRLIDGSASRNIYQAVHTSNVDIPDGIWQTNSGSRWSMLYTRIANFTAGTDLRLYINSDAAVANLSDASLNISLISLN